MTSLAMLWCLAAASVSAAPAQTTVHHAGDAPGVPPWLFPLNPPNEVGGQAIDHEKPVSLSGSQRQFTEAQLNDLFYAPDWYPESHSPMPDIVLRGRTPDTFACGYCHSPSGQGRPENASLAGLPAAYIVQQVADMKSGARGSAWHGGPYRPVDLMQKVAANASQADVNAAAVYFAAQTLRPRVTVIERARIPRMQVIGWVYALDPRGGDEPLGQRLIEWSPDPSRHERRDDLMRYTAFVSPGSIGRGRAIATKAKDAGAQPCSSCHGEHLLGVGLIPPLAGRSPTYLMRQLLAFQTGDRAGAAGAPMQAVAATLNLADMIAVAAYAGSLEAQPHPDGNEAGHLAVRRDAPVACLDEK